ncbi:MAG: amino acid adenylation domain-containing protein [Acidobacteriota bacterium]
MSTDPRSLSYDGENCVSDLFERQSRRTPHAVALLGEEGPVTYAQLNAKANALAHRLRAAGVGPEARVAICVDRSVRMVAGILGILKAGGAYVPIDPVHPRERIAFLLHDAAPRALLTESLHRDSLPPFPGEVLLVDLEGEGDPVLNDPGNLPGFGGADSLAYIMYTSGSTGKPKGVEILHRGIVRLVRDTDYASFSSDETFLQAAPLSFDASTFEIWGSLLNGARLALLPPGPPSPDTIAEAVERYGVTTLWLTAALFHETVDQRLTSLSGLRQLLAGGDVLSVPHVTRALRSLPGCRVINGYGPTENTTFTCCYALTGDETLGSSVPIGRPIARTRVLILNEELRPVAAGEAGELWIAGDGLARGYWNDPELTARKFVESPVPELEAGRLYRSGDLARYRADGNIEFLGRIDQQVKIHGYRIEPGEIETAIREQPEVRDCVVVAREEPTGDRRLIAYIVAVPSSGLPVPPGETHLPPGAPTDQGGASSFFVRLVPDLRRRLRERLPESMIPSAFVPLDRIPMTPNGKVDRRALPAPSRSRPPLSVAYAAPRKPVEIAVVAMFREVLGIDEVGIHDDFFDLGGHSLSATRVISRVRRDFPTDVSVMEFFALPTAAALGARIEATPATVQRAARLRPMPRPGEIPLSYSQQRLWFLDQLDPGAVAYNVSRAMRLEGRLDRGALERALAEVSARHEALRTTFPSREGRPVQRVSAHADVVITDADLSKTGEGETSLARALTEEAGRPFDLARGPLMRATLFRLSDEEHVLLFNMHHIVTDGWSMGILFRELEALYGAFSQGQPSPLPPLAIQYPDFAIWQRQALAGDALRPGLEYWEKALAGPLPALELPTDRPRPAIQRFRGGRLGFSIDAGTERRLAEFSRTHGGTPFMTLLATFDVLLSRYAGQSEILVGIPVANRSQPEIENLIGFFTNSLVMRVELAEKETFRSLVGRVKKISLEGFAHEDVPFEVLVEKLQPERTLSHNPLFQVLFAFQNASDESMRLRGLAVTPVPVEEGTSRFSLTLSIWPTAAGFEGRFDYDTDLFGEATISRMSRHFLRLLASGLADPDRPVEDLSLMDEEEMKSLLAAWSPVPEAGGPVRCVHELFEEQAALRPHSIAVVSGGEAVTYADLESRSAALADRLRASGAAPEVVVGLCLDRSVDLLVGLLGILRSGAAYLPLDPSLPAARLAHFVEDAGARLVVTDRKLREIFSATGADVVPIDGLSTDPPRSAPAAPARRASPADAAYVIYTSGSTGKPKAVVVEHRQLAHYVRAATDRLALEPGMSFALVSSMAADLGNTSLFPSLACGGSLHVLSKEQAGDAEAMACYFRENSIDCLKIVPSHLAALLTCEEPSSVLPRKRLIFGGERLSWDLVDKVSALAPDCEIFNHYGPTETTIGAIAGRVDPRRERTGGSAPLGRPLSHARVFLLDARGRPVPPGVAGEIFIGGLGVARGYLGRPDLTAERFLPNPLAGEGDRFYRTGDRARYAADGSIEFLGRVDDQVKVRGHRVEPGEIEAALRRIPNVRECAVVPREELGALRLIACLVAEDARRLDVAAIRRALHEVLPDHMVPGGFAVVDHLPRTGNGKIDRIALRTVPVQTLDSRSSSRVPRTDAEKALANIWARVLQLEAVGIDENFFDLGGDSILSIQIVAQAARAGLRITPRLLFQHQTVAGLAGAARPAGPAAGEQGLVTGDVPRTPIQARFIERGLSNPNHFNQSVLLAAAVPLDSARLSRAVRALLAHHDALRLRCVSHPPRQFVEAPADDVPFRRIDLVAWPPERRQAAMEQAASAAQASMNLERGPLARVIQFANAPGSGDRILIAVHHFAIDAVSWPILLEDLRSAYEQAAGAGPIRLPAKTTSFQAWATGLAAYADSPELATELPFWLEVAAVDDMGLPADRVASAERPASASRTDIVSVAIEADETRALIADVPHVYRTQVNDVLLTALVQAINGWTKRSRLLVDLEGHGREDILEGIDLTRTVGWFTSRFPAVLTLEAGTGAGESLKSIKEQLRKIPRRGVGYGILRYLHRDERVRERLSRPVPSVSFNYLGQLDATIGETGFSYSNEFRGLEIGIDEKPMYSLDVNGGISGGRLQFEWTFDTRRFSVSTVRSVAESFRSSLRGLIHHCRSPHAGGFTPSDFPEAGLSQDELDRLIAKLA